ncbi:MAG TPA: hypothetical protein DDX98_07690 [Bacteroidales bacterium]|jgi:hypothetical protein|nr:hypothetical protein [Bacteroidales bacterium]
MLQNNTISSISKLFVAFLLVFSISSCQSGQKKTDKDISIDDFLTEDVIFDDIDKAKKIFYSLPSPLETALIMKSAGAKYDQEILNSIDNVQNYTTNRSMALNLGIYTTDLSFASLFEQTQASIDYMGAARAMAEGLDITDAINRDTMEKLEANLNNRDVVMDIISETFLNSSSYLKENERQDVAAIVLVGGWIEGLYLAAELTEGQPVKNNKLVDRILEQKLSLNIVHRLLEDNKTKNSGEVNDDIIELIAELQDLKSAFDKVNVETTQPSVEGENAEGVANIRSRTTVSVEQEDFVALQASIVKLRTSFVQ